MSARLPRAARRSQLLTAACRCFAEHGYEAVSVDAVANEAGVTKAIVYRHVESKLELYRAARDHARERVEAAVGPAPYDASIVDRLLDAAEADPDAFRMVLDPVVREPDLLAEAKEYAQQMVVTASDEVAGRVTDPAWASWAAALLPRLTIDAITAWMDAGRPDPATAAARITAVLAGVLTAADQEPGTR